MTSQTLIIIVAALLTTTSVVTALTTNVSKREIQRDLDQAQLALDSAILRIQSAQDSISILKDFVSENIDLFHHFESRRDSLILARHEALGSTKDSINQEVKSIDSLINTLSSE